MTSEKKNTTLSTLVQTTEGLTELSIADTKVLAAAAVMAVEYKERVALNKFLGHVAEKFPSLGKTLVPRSGRLIVRLRNVTLKSVGRLFISESCSILEEAGVSYTVRVLGSESGLLRTSIELHFVRMQTGPLQKMHELDLEESAVLSRSFLNLDEFPLPKPRLFSRATKKRPDNDEELPF